jgi:hypothetical protein
MSFLSTYAWNWKKHALAYCTAPDHACIRWSTWVRFSMHLPCPCYVLTLDTAFLLFNSTPILSFQLQSATGLRLHSSRPTACTQWGGSWSACVLHKVCAKLQSTAEQTFAFFFFYFLLLGGPDTKWSVLVLKIPTRSGSMKPSTTTGVPNRTIAGPGEISLAVDEREHRAGASHLAYLADSQKPPSLGPSALGRDVVYLSYILYCFQSPGHWWFDFVRWGCPN